METTWSLNELYSSYESKEFKEDFEKLGKIIETIKLWANKELKSNDNLKEKLEKYINYQIELEPLLNTRFYVFLALSTDCNNEKLNKLDDKIEEMMTELTEPEVLFQMFIKDIENLNDVISSSELLKDHEFFLIELKEGCEHLLSDKEEILLAKMKNTGSTAWSKLSEQLVSTMTIKMEVNGEMKDEPLSMIRNYAYEPDAKLRKDAYEAELNAYPRVEQAMAGALNNIKGEVITESKMRGYKSPLEMTVKDSLLEMDVLNALIESMKDSMPMFRKFYKRKAELLGNKSQLPFYDLFAPVGEVDLTFTYEEAAEYIIKHFTEFYKPLGDYAKHAFDNNWVDVYPKKGKRGGAFCDNLHSLKESRILTNFTGSFSDMITLAHELGHGYHGHCLNDEYFLNSDYSMPIAETASTFCETIVTKAAIKTATKQEALVILENDITGMAQVIVDICSRFIFEDELFAKRVDGSLSPEELCTMMKNAQLATYGDSLDPNYLHSYMWVPKTHYYSADRNYYNFPYAYGLLFAKGLYKKHIEYQEKGEEFMPIYDKMLSITGKNNLKDIALYAKIDVTKKEFWKQSIDMIKEDIDMFLEISAENI